jgi:hypothetical protein
LFLQTSVICLSTYVLPTTVISDIPRDLFNMANVAPTKTTIILRIVLEQSVCLCKEFLQKQFMAHHFCEPPIMPHFCEPLIFFAHWALCCGDCNTGHIPWLGVELLVSQCCLHSKNMGASPKLLSMSRRSSFALLLVIVSTVIKSL